MKNLIQKYFMAIVAVMMVIGFSAFKLAETSTEEAELKGCATNFDDDLVLFIFDPSDGYGEDEVTNHTKWAQNPSHNCGDEADEKACAIRVSEDFVDPNNQTLLSTINLQATEFGSTGDYYISGSADDEMIPINVERQ